MATSNNISVTVKIAGYSIKNEVPASQEKAIRDAAKEIDDKFNAYKVLAAEKKMNSKEGEDLRLLAFAALEVLANEKIRSYSKKNEVLLEQMEIINQQLNDLLK